MGRRCGWKLSEETRLKMSESRKGKNNNFFGKKHTEETLAKMRGRKLTFETREKMSKARKGKRLSEETKQRMKLSARRGILSPVWITDRTKLKTDRRQSYDVRYREWMLAVKNRDCWKCRISNGDCSGYLESHHILSWKDYPELRYEINNGITLCHFHHPKRREEEKRLSPYFQELVSASKV